MKSMSTEKGKSMEVEKENPRNGMRNDLSVLLNFVLN